MENNTNRVNLYERAMIGIHFPTSKSDIAKPLYKRATSNTVNGDSPDSAEQETYNATYSTASSEFLSEIETTYSSPRNIRRLFIGINTSVVHLWAPIVKNGKCKTTLEESVTAQDKIEQNEIGSLALRGKSDRHAVSNKRVGLEAIKGWSLKNLEEMYFDATLLINAENSTQRYIDTILKVYKPGGGVKDDNNEEFKKLIETILNCSLSKDYPRLKRIMFIADLDKIISNITNTSYTGQGADSLDKLRTDWFSSIDSTKLLGYIGCRGVNFGKLSYQFSACTGLYQFDSEFLVEKFRDIQRRIDRLKEEAKTANLQSETQDKTEINDFEKLLNELDNKGISEDIIYELLLAYGAGDFTKMTNYSASLSSEAVQKHGELIKKALLSCKRD